MYYLARVTDRTHYLYNEEIIVRDFGVNDYYSEEHDEMFFGWQVVLIKEMDLHE